MTRFVLIIQGMVLRTLATSKVSRARIGVLCTKDGVVETPAFVAVATNAALKAVDMRDVPDLGLIFCNTYHLLLHPGPDVIKDAGGIRKFMNVDSLIMTDSGGFQVFSLKYGTVHDELERVTSSLKMHAPHTKKNRRTSDVTIHESGVSFRSYRDGTRLELTPELSVTAQKALNGSIIMPLDELAPYHMCRDSLRNSVERTHRWMKRSLDTHLSARQGQLMYGIVHGGSDRALRKESVDFCTAQQFDGFAIGGALGKDREELYDIVRYVMDDQDGDGCGLRRAACRDDKPVHVLGIADPWNIRRLVELGCDTFDACYATKISRHGTMLSGEFQNPTRLSIKSGRWKDVHEKLNCACSTCQKYTLSYLHHLYKAREPLVDRLISVHNLSFMTNLMRSIREEIKNGSL